MLFLLSEINLPDLFQYCKWRQRQYMCATYCTKYLSGISEYRKEMPTELGMCQCQRCLCQSIPMKFTTWQKAIRQDRFAVGWGSILNRQWNQISHLGGLIGGCLFSCPSDVKLVVNFVAMKEASGKGCFSSSTPWESNTFILKAFHQEPPATFWLSLAIAISNTTAAHFTMTCWRENDWKSQSMSHGEAVAQHCRR